MAGTMRLDRIALRKALSAPFRLSAIPAALGLISSSVLAAPTIYLGDKTTLDYSITTSYTVSSRIDDPASEYLNSLNNDDGTRNFDRWSLFTNRVNALAEARLKHDNLGGVVRGSVFYDWAYRSSNDNDSPDTVLARQVTQIALYEESRLAGALKVKIDRDTGTIYKSSDIPEYVTGYERTKLIDWIEGRKLAGEPADKLADLRYKKVNRGNGFIVVVQAHVKCFNFLWPISYKNRLFKICLGKISFVLSLKV